MRTVTKEEAENTKNNLLKWAKDGKVSGKGNLGEWIYSNLGESKEKLPEKNISVSSLTENAVQKNWKTPSEFPNCPMEIEDNSLVKYCERLDKGKVFAKDKYKKSTVHNAKISKSTNELLVICHHPDQLKHWSLAKVFIKDQKFVHESLGTFFKLTGAEKEFTIALGEKWEGGETFDDLAG